MILIGKINASVHIFLKVDLRNKKVGLREHANIHISTQSHFYEKNDFFGKAVPDFHIAKTFVFPLQNPPNGDSKWHKLPKRSLFQTMRERAVTACWGHRNYISPRRQWTVERHLGYGRPIGWLALSTNAGGSGTRFKLDIHDTTPHITWMGLMCSH